MFSGNQLAAPVSPPRATASAPRMRSSAPSPSTPRWPTRTSESACTTITRRSPRPPSGCCGGYSSCPAATATKAAKNCSARDGGQLLRSEAHYQLHLLYLWYERRPKSALELLEGLIARHPSNPRFRQAAAEVHDVYLHDSRASLRSWEALLDAVHTGRVAEPAMAETAARLGIALQLDRLSRSDAALEHLRAVIAMRPDKPFGSFARAHLQLGDALGHLGRRDEASAAYRAAITATGASDPLDIAARASTALRAIDR